MKYSRYVQLKVSTKGLQAAAAAQTVERTRPPIRTSPVCRGQDTEPQIAPEGRAISVIHHVDDKI